MQIDVSNASIHPIHHSCALFNSSRIGPMIPQPIPSPSLTPEPVPSVGSPVSPNSAISTNCEQPEWATALESISKQMKQTHFTQTESYVCPHTAAASSRTNRCDIISAASENKRQTSNGSKEFAAMDQRNNQ